MSRRAEHSTSLAVRVALIGGAAVLMATGVILLDDVASRRVVAADDVVPVSVITAATPIAAEADVFRTSPPDLDDAPSRRPAHGRSLATFRALRAYPGAPPRIPHGLTADEFRTTACRTCHERGGYVPRFDAYAPVTPHPELADCLQCHTGDADLVGTALPGAAVDGVCRQCHTPGVRRALPALDWRAAPWPELARATNTPPPIPHDLTLRGNCVACHAGPGAVAELRTTHPERADCRQCHLHAAEGTDEYRRPGVSPSDGAEQ
jgi:nitrate reductase (cytochrome), electron transfer subunit